MTGEHLKKVSSAHIAGVKKVFEEEGIAKGSAAVSYKGKMVDTPVYENALQILRTMEEIKAVDAKW